MMLLMVFSIRLRLLYTTVITEITGNPGTFRGDRSFTRVPPCNVASIMIGLDRKLVNFAQKPDMFYGLLKLQRFLEAFYQALISLVRVFFRFRFRSDLNQIDDSGKELVILANGPSLRADLDNHPGFFSDKHLMCVNQFVLSDDYERIKPGYYVLLDMGFFVEHPIPRVAEVREQVKQAMIRKTSWPMTLCCPAEARNSHFHRDLQAAGVPVKFAFFNRTVVDGIKPVRHWLYRRQAGMPPPQNVLIGALMVGLACRFSRIIILGADHSWHLGFEIGADGKLLSTEHHFYDRQPWKVAVEHPETRKRATLHDYFYILYRTFRSYHLIEEFAGSVGTRIINASSVTFIDAFERKDLAGYPWDQR